MKVTLVKTDTDKKTWVHTTWFRAWRRARALASLHSTRIFKRGDELIVDARRYYCRVKANVNPDMP